MRFLGEVLVNLQSHDVVFAFQIDDGSSPAYVLFCNSKRKFPVGRFVSDDVFRFKRWHEAINNQNDRDCRHRFEAEVSRETNAVKTMSAIAIILIVNCLVPSLEAKDIIRDKSPDGKFALRITKEDVG